MAQIVIGILALIRSLPDLFVIAKELIKFLNETKDYLERREKLKELKEASKLAVKGDTSGYEKLFRAKSDDSAS